MSRDVGVGQLVEELEERGDRLPFEIGAFVALEACEGLLRESVKLEPDDVRVTLEGSVVVAESAESADPDEAARSLVSVLARLLVAAGPGVPPYLLQLVKESATSQRPSDLRYLHDAIEASLIPINRGASRRVLARLVRESDRPPAPVVPEVSPRELDAELDELLADPVIRNLEPAQAALPLPDDLPGEPITERIRVPKEISQPDTLPVPPSEPALRSAAQAAPHLDAPRAPVAAPALRMDESPQLGLEPITATIKKWPSQEEPPIAEPIEHPVLELEPETASGDLAAPAPVTAPVPVTAPAIASAPEPVIAPAPALAPVTEPVTGTESVTEIATEPAIRTGSPPSPEPTYDRGSLPVAQPPRRRGGWGVWVFAAALGLGAYALIASGTLDTLLRPATPVIVPSPSGVIDVTVTPADAQIFVFIGRGPAVAEGMPVGHAHEFIVFDRGLRPSRATIAEDATWTDTDGGPLYELAVQAQAVGDPIDALDLGDPQSEPSERASERTGVVRVVTNPPGAKVYRFVSIGPNAQIDVPSIHEGQEVLVYRQGYETRRAVIGPSDWRVGSSDDAQNASLNVQLPAIAASAVAETTEN